MATERGIIYKDAKGQIILLRLNPVRKRVFTLTDDPYANLARDKADVVEVLDDNEAISMTNIRPLRGMTFTGREDEPVPACEAIEYALAANPEAIAEMMAAATEDGGMVI